MNLYKTVISISYSKNYQRILSENVKLADKEAISGNILGKSYWSLILEAILEYYRIVYDIYINERQIALLVSFFKCHDNVMLTWHNNYSDNVMKKLAELNMEIIRADIEDEHDHINKTKENIESAFLHLIKSKPNSDTIRYNGRIILFVHIDSEATLSELIDYIKNLYYKLNVIGEITSPIIILELVFINILDNDKPYHLPRSHQRIDKNIKMEFYNVTPGKTLTELMLYLVQKHFDLSSTTVTGIPMKEEQNASASSTNYDVEILHSARAYLSEPLMDLRESQMAHPKQEPTEAVRACCTYPKSLRTRPSAGATYETVLLQWCTPPKNALHSNEYYQQNCRGAFRISPVHPHSRPSSCLTNFLLSNRIVLLERIHVPPFPKLAPQGREQAGPVTGMGLNPVGAAQTFASAYTQALGLGAGPISGASRYTAQGSSSPFCSTTGSSKLLSHMLASFGGCIFLMPLVTSRTLLDDPPSISEGVGGRVTDYRIPDFSKLIMLCRLTNQIPDPNAQVPAQGPSLTSAKILLDQLTSYWPMVYGESLLLNIPLLSPFVDKLVNSVILSDKSERQRAKQECIEILEAFREMENQNQPLPSQTTMSGSLRSSSSASARKESYRQVWAELERVIQTFDRWQSYPEYREIRQQLIVFGGKNVFSSTATNASTPPNTGDKEKGPKDVIKRIKKVADGDNGNIGPGADDETSSSNPSLAMDWDDIAKSPDQGSIFKIGKPKPFGLVWRDIMNNKRVSSTKIRPELEERSMGENSKIELYSFLKERNYAK